MEHLNDENFISIKTENYLRHKYLNAISKFAKLNEDNFIDEWNKALQTGEIDEIFYVAATRDDLSLKTIENIFGDVHMLCHANLREVIISRRKLDLQKTSNLELSKRIKEGRDRSRKLKKENLMLKTTLNETRGLLDKTKTDHDKIESEKKENQLLYDKLKKTEEQYNQEKEHSCDLEREKKRIQGKLLNLQTTNKTLANEIEGLIMQISDFLNYDKNCDEKCPIFHLCAKRILIVGGITKIKHLYKKLVELRGGQFNYHDGYMKNRKHNMEAKVIQSDLILFPVNCNSHGACNEVKRLCKKHNKPIKMLPSSSLSSISNALAA